MARFRNTGQPDWDWWRELWGDPGETLRAVGADEAGSLVDVGCGDGYFTIRAAERCDGPVYGVDLDGDLLADLRARAADAGVDVIAIRGDARDLPDLLPTTVDVALFANAFHGVDDKVEFAGGVRDALVDGGRFAVVNWRPLPREETVVGGEPRGPPTELRLTPTETREAVEAAGFDHVEIVDLPPYHYGAVFERT
ncbi:class I SAM-dependent methyltransferase [Halegenticoccus tardaugens]|uniref:class I SAM-dependent methyltransferase n=1 Tax=Halegenticoccus tardaugens TaxID=2071624 RepID=UPI00100BFEEC|nr:class I SAM-dependent methyltransferase [Halegenticoccus tardaugens]